ncbi:MAG: thiamine permease [Alphaproteobacteria bacterium]|nr:thiamine permease [Alphaproteobacteria bacterium]
MTTSDTSRRWTQRETVIVAALGAAFGVLYLGWVQLWLLVQTVIGPLALDMMLGFWCVVSVVAAYIIRKPFAAFTAEMVAAIAEVLTGNPAGLILILTGAVQGAGAELPFAATGWRSYRLPVLLASGASAAIFSFVYNWVRFHYGNLDAGLLVLMFVIRIASGIVLAGLLGRFIADRLHRTGVLAGLAIDRERTAPVGGQA